ncbi:hypothetical protein CQW23_01649 [Capsicum baccatum]|uniref:Uncharacterized protein n=1 Tax=Capsicum baccatum TaxID=33114 RepID=A0A2G2XP71_CAPBA|nr:hypothetical protein CQW23_01649 [Capsicum baccatum]
MASNDEHHQSVAVEKPSKFERVEKSTKKAVKSSVVMLRVVRIYMTDNDTTDSSSAEEEMLQGEKSQRPKKLWIKEIMIENGRTRVISKKKSKEKKLFQANPAAKDSLVARAKTKIAPGNAYAATKISEVTKVSIERLQVGKLRRML